MSPAFYMLQTKFIPSPPSLPFLFKPEMDCDKIETVFFLNQSRLSKSECGREWVEERGEVDLYVERKKN